MRITNIQRFCMHDGPGIRTTVFLKGCPLRCAWCHNPETQNTGPELLYFLQKCIGCGACQICPQGVHRFSSAHELDRERCAACGRCADQCPTGALELVGKDQTVEEVYALVAKDMAFYGSEGGVTVSGGEPLVQSEEVAALLKLCREAGIHTAIETCGYASAAALERVLPWTDLLLWDIKDTDSQRHAAGTGVSNERILENLHSADAWGVKTRLRCILVNTVNTDLAHYGAVAALAASVQHCEGVEFLPYHVYGGEKALAMAQPLRRSDAWIPTSDQLAEAKALLHSCGITVF